MDSRAVGFLDAPDVDLGALLTMVVDAFEGLDDDAVLSVYSNGAFETEIAERCPGLGVDLVHVVPQPNGTTFILRRSGG